MENHQIHNLHVERMKANGIQCIEKEKIQLFSNSDTAVNWHIRSKFIYKLLCPERNSTNACKPATYPQSYILPCLFRHLTWERPYIGILFFLLFIYAIQDSHILEKSSNNTSNNPACVIQEPVLVFFFEGQRDKCESLQGNGTDRMNFQAEVCFCCCCCCC